MDKTQKNIIKELKNQGSLTSQELLTALGCTSPSKAEKVGAALWDLKNAGVVQEVGGVVTLTQAS